MLNVACMQKIKIGHRAKFRDKDKYFLQLLFPVRAILRCISTSGVVRARILIEILTNFAHAYISVMAWMGYARARLKTLSSLLNQKVSFFSHDNIISTVERIIVECLRNHSISNFSFTCGFGNICRETKFSFCK